MQKAGFLTTRLKLLNVCIYEHVIIRYNTFIYDYVWFFLWLETQNKKRVPSRAKWSVIFILREIIFIMVVAKYGLVHDVETINQHLEIVSEI